MNASRRRETGWNCLLGTSCIVALAAIAACSDVPTSPRADVTPGRELAASVSPGAAAGKLTFRGASGRVFTLDVRRATLSDGQNRSISLRPEQLVAVQRLFDNAARIEARMAQFRADPGYLRCLASALQTGRRMRMRFGTAPSLAPPVPAGALAPALAAPRTRSEPTRAGAPEAWPATSSAALTEESDDCRNISQLIYETNIKYEAALAEYERLLAEMFMLGIGIGPDGVTYNPDGAATGYTAKLDWAAFEVMNYRLQLDFLAIQYSLFGCWNQPGDYTSGTSGSTDTGDATACHTEWIIMEISYDGGLTWSTYWEGWGEVCE